MAAKIALSSWCISYPKVYSKYIFNLVGDGSNFISWDILFIMLKLKIVFQSACEGEHYCHFSSSVGEIKYPINKKRESYRIKICQELNTCFIWLFDYYLEICIQTKGLISK